MGSATAATEKRRRRELRALAAATLLTALFAGGALACGYENPQSVALGVMNWVYPKSLYVRTAVWQAEDAGVLPPRETKPEKDLFGLGFRRAVDSLNGLGARVENAGGNDFHFSVVLIPQVMWTGFAPVDGGDVRVEPHASGPAEGDVVIVTTDKVVRALVDGAVGFSQAESLGLVRLYGDARRQTELRRMLRRALVRGAAPEAIGHVNSTF